jgi:hypothetical protein
MIEGVKNMSKKIILLSIFMFTLAYVMVFNYGGCNSSSDSGSSVTVVAPSNLVVTMASSNILVTWQDNSDNETCFCLYAKSYDASSWNLVSSLIPASATSYSFPSSTLGYAGSNFQFCLTAYDSNDSVESDTSNIATLSW